MVASSGVTSTFASKLSSLNLENKFSGFSSISSLTINISTGIRSILALNVSSMSKAEKSSGPAYRHRTNFMQMSSPSQLKGYSWILFPMNKIFLDTIPSEQDYQYILDTILNEQDIREYSSQ